MNFDLQAFPGPHWPQERTLRKGDKAFYDSFLGLVPCKVDCIAGRSGIASASQIVTVTVTANHGAYKRGETVVTSGLHVVPRNAVQRRAYSTTILPYGIEAE